ncbi:MAG: hypothetical protein EHM61_22290 [Acidobacteria bacterium]|nr:MAG: hypothetical protein EHM61_22290 [Acidobacteriota bacterium]
MAPRSGLHLGEKIARRILGYSFEYVIKLWGVAAALNVILGDAETVGQKVGKTFTAVPDLTANYRRIRYVADHSEQINQALDYLQKNAPTPAELQAAVNRTYETLSRLNTSLAHLEKAKENLLSWSWQPGETLEHLRQGWSLMPDLDAFRYLAVASEKAAGAIERLRQIDLNPLYHLLMNGIDNFARDEVAGTVVVSLAAMLIASTTGVLIGRFWARRGMPGLITLQVQRLGVRAFPAWYERNLERVLGRELYGVAARHFAEKASEERAGQVDKRQAPKGPQGPQGQKR